MASENYSIRCINSTQLTEIFRSVHGVVASIAYLLVVVPAVGILGLFLIVQAEESAYSVRAHIENSVCIAYFLLIDDCN